jgi:hypothetical protein
MYTIQRNADSDEPTGVATPETEAVVETEAAQGGEAPAETNAEPTELEDDNFDFEESGSEPASPSTGNGTAPAAPQSEATVSKKEYDVILTKLRDSEAKVAQLSTAVQEMQSNTLVKAALEYSEVIGTGVEINPSDFVRNYFGVDADNLSAEDLIKLEIQEDAVKAGVQLNEDDFESTLEKRLESIENLDNLAKAVKLKEMRENRKRAAKEKQDKLISERKADLEKGKQFWVDAYEKGILPQIERIKSEKKKDFGLSEEFDEAKVASIEATLLNNFYKFNPDGSLNTKHALEVAHFSSDIKTYTQKIAERAVAKYKLSQLKTGAPGAGSPSAVAKGAEKGVTTKSIGDINSLEGRTVIKPTNN